MTTDQPKFGPEQFGAGETIFRQDDPPEQFYILTSGTVAVVRQTADGVERAINQLGPGDFFGEIGMLQWQRRLATVRAVTNVHVMTMDRATFRRWLSSSELVAAEIGATSAQRMAQGQVILSQGETADKFYIIVKGRVEVVTDQLDGSERFVAHLESGDYFGEIGLLIGGMRVATVRALNDVQTVSFDREAFVKWLSKSPESKSNVVSTAHERLSDIVNKRKQPRG